VTPEGDVLVNPSFVQKFTLRQLEMVVLHERLHWEYAQLSTHS
jgi:beta-lactamase regulating signal transducer with metallopeptidase domain